jgi:hypothetical protein
MHLVSLKSVPGKLRELGQARRAAREAAAAAGGEAAAPEEEVRPPRSHGRRVWLRARGWLE